MLTPTLLRDVRAIAADRWPGALSASRIDRDRDGYHGGDAVGHFVVGLAGVSSGAMEVLLRNGVGGVVLETAAVPGSSRFAEFIVDIALLAAGEYEVEVSVDGVTRASTVFVKSALGPLVTGSLPAGGIPIVVHPQGVLAGARVPMATGVPLPDGAVTDVGQLVLRENGTAIPAQFGVRSTWGPNGSIRWLGLDFVAQYDGLTPRSYTLELGQNPTPSRPVSVVETTDSLWVDNGAIRFMVSRRNFAGVEHLARSKGRFPPHRAQEALGGGPYVVDENGVTYVAAGDDVYVEEGGPVRATIRAEGWYIDPETGAALCRFVTRITTYAGSLSVDVAHRTIITYDTDEDRISDVGWATRLGTVPRTVAFGIEGQAPYTHPLRRGEIFLHQETADRFRIVNRNVVSEEGARASGWVSVDLTRKDRLTIAARDFFERFPKELEVTTDPSGQEAVAVVHFWPWHGTPTFSNPPAGSTRPPETSPSELYKIRYAHEAKLLSLHAPAAYVTAAQNQLQAEENNPNFENQAARFETSNGQGLAIATEFSLRLARESLEDASDNAALFQADLHAAPAPAATIASRVFGVVDNAAGTDPALQVMHERMDEDYFRDIVKAGDEYGMWIYGATHNQWDALENRARLHRVWQLSHYQEVSHAWLRYLLYGRPGEWEWARATSSQFMDIATNNYSDVTNVDHGAHGDIYHGKGIAPFSGDSGPYEHFIDPDAYAFRWYITGDARARELHDAWFARFVATATGDPLTGHGPWLPGSTMRDLVVGLGATVERYHMTHDPVALAILRRWSEAALAGPFANTVSPGDHPVWGSVWYSRLHALTRDAAIVARLEEWTQAGFLDAAVAGFLYSVNGDATLLDPFGPGAYDAARVRYDAPGERYDGYGAHFLASSARWLHALPYYVAGLKASGRTIERGTIRGTYPGFSSLSTFNTRPDGSHRGWSIAGVTVLVDPSVPIGASSADVHASYEWIPGQGDPMGEVWVSKPEAERCTSAAGCVFGTYVPPAEMGLGQWGLPNILAGPLQLVTYGPIAQTFAVIGGADPYRIELHAHAHGVLAPVTDRAEVAVLRRERRVSGVMQSARVHCVGGRQSYFMRPLAPHGASVVLRISGGVPKQLGALTYASMPASFRIERPDGTLVHQGSVFLFGTSPFVDVVLDDFSDDYYFYSATSYGHDLEILCGTEEMLLAVEQNSLDVIEPMLAALGCDCNGTPCLCEDSRH
jgi:hypothetical protein